MPVIKSAKKRVRQTAKATARNMRIKKSLREAVKHLQTAIDKRDHKKIKQTQSQVDSILDTAAKKKLFHKNKVARKKSQVAKTVKAATKKSVSSKPSPVKTKKPTVAKTKPTAKKTTVKKAVAKKPAAKKAPTKATKTA